MGMSAEYPDLKFVPPRAFGSGRDGKAVRYLVVHYTAGAERSTSAEDGAAYDQRRTDGTSCHYFVDSDSVVQCVRTTDRSNSAFGKGNRLGIHYEFCGTAQTRAQWLDLASRATIRNAARQMARDAHRYEIPIRRLSAAETRAAWYSFPAGPKGIVGHGDVTNAYPEDGGDHTDPGKDFPWDVLLADINEFLGSPTTSGGDMAPTQENFRILALLENTPTTGWSPPEKNGLHEALKRIEDKVAAPAPVTVDAAAVAAALAGNTAFLAAIAKAVADETARRQQA